MENQKLPPELNHSKVREVRDVGTVYGKAFQIVFDQHYLPYSYWSPKPDGWQMTYARVEYHKDSSGLFSWLIPEKECITIVVCEDG